MSITDELRERIDAVCRVSGWDCKRLTAIADRIDAEHEEALREAYTKGREDGMGVAKRADMRAEYLRGKNDGYDAGWDAGFASADDWCAQHEDAMNEHGWYQALGADKQPIKFGDEVEWRHNCGSCELRHGIVTGIKTDKIGDEMFYEVTVKVDRFTVRLMANQLRHYHVPTVEDLLDEFVERWHDTHHDDIPALKAEYAAKLQLRGDAE